MVPAILAAAALGLLTGSLVGLSAAPVVAAVVSALLAMAAGIAALTGIRNPFAKEGAGEGADGALRGRRHDLAACAFALATIAGVAGGLWVRNHNLLSPDPAALQAEWQALGFDRDTAARIALAALTGIAIDREGAARVAPAEGPGASTILFSTDEEAACQRTDPARAPSAEEARRAWRLAPGDWPAFAITMQAADTEALTLFWRTVCEERAQ